MFVCSGAKHPQCARVGVGACVLEEIWTTVMESGIPRDRAPQRAASEWKAGPGCEVVISAAQSERAESARTSQANNSVSLFNTATPIVLGFWCFLFLPHPFPVGGMKRETRERKNHKHEQTHASLPDTTAASSAKPLVVQPDQGPVGSVQSAHHTGRRRPCLRLFNQDKKKRLNSVFLNITLLSRQG